LGQNTKATGTNSRTIGTFVPVVIRPGVSPYPVRRWSAFD